MYLDIPTPRIGLLATPFNTCGISFVITSYSIHYTKLYELFDFVNEESSPKYDLLKMAIAHHRFMWIHPFGNGNGRVGRLFTYALLVKAGFNVHVGRILNPTAIFCNDRDQYYKFLSGADADSDEGLIDWCTYVV